MIMNYRDDNMETSISDIKNYKQIYEKESHGNLGKKLEYEFDNYLEPVEYNPNNIPQAALQRAPPMRNGELTNYKTHQTIPNDVNNYPQTNYYPNTNYPQQNYPQQNYQQEYNNPSNNLQKDITLFEGFFCGLYKRMIDPIIIGLLFIVLAHRLTAQKINPYLPFVSDSPSTDLVSLGLRGFILSVLYLIIKSQL